MKKSLASLAFCVTSLGLAAGQASAVPLVAAGSSYSVYLDGDMSGDPFLASTTFDGVPESATRGGLNLVFDESETPSSATSSHITLTVSANGDLFPVTNETAYVGIGVDGNGLDLVSPVTLTDARVTFSDENGNVVQVFDDLAGLVDQNSPWDGSFLGNDDVAGFPDVGGMDVANITFDFDVTQQTQADVPEPASLMLCGLGLAGIGAARRRARRNAA